MTTPNSPAEALIKKIIADDRNPEMVWFPLDEMQKLARALAVALDALSAIDALAKNGDQTTTECAMAYSAQDALAEINRIAEGKE